MRLNVAEPNFNASDIRAVTKAIRSGMVSGNAPVVKEFEEAFAKKTGRKYAVSVNSGSSALLLSLIALKPKHIMIPDFCYIAVPNAARLANIPFGLVDVGMDGNIVSGSKSIAVHTYGHVYQGRSLIEDAAEAIGLQTNRSRVTCFSFFANKTMTTGEGGMITTDEPDIVQKLRGLRENFNNKHETLHYFHDDVGYGMRMSGLQAALGLSQLKRLDSFLAKKKWIEKTYTKLLKDLPVVPWGGQWMYGILVEPKDRNSLMAHLLEDEIETRNFFLPIHIQKPYKQEGSFPRATYLFERGLYLPSGTTLTKKDLQRVSNSIALFYGTHSSRR